MKRLKVLISAHELSPRLGSECAVGWNLITRLGQYHDVTVLFAERNQFGTRNYAEDIRKYISESGPVTGVSFVQVPQPFMTRILAGINRRVSSKDSSTGFAPLYFWGYKYWQKAAFAEAKKLCQAQAFDIVHLLTSISYREPGYLWKLDLPFVWGPTSGTFNTPMKFVIRGGFGELIFELFRRLSNFSKRNFSSRISRAIGKASLIYAVSKEDRSFFEKRGSGKTDLLLDTGSLILPESGLSHKPKPKISIVWCGRLVPSKGLDLFLRALERCSFGLDQVSVKVIGKGPLMPAGKRLAKRLNLDSIEWTGQVSQEKVFDYLKDADILVHTSYKEAASTVITEALSFGTAIICHDAYGMAVAIDTSCGIKVPLLSPKDSIKGFGDAITGLVTDPEKLKKMKTNALARARELSWDSMASRIAQDYESIAH